MKPRIPTPVLKATLPAIRRAVLDRRTPLAMRRASTDAIVGSVPWPRGSTATRGSLGGVPAVRIDPADAPVDQAAGAILYLHGGGYLVGSSRSHRPVGTRLALGTGLPVLIPDYRMAPEHPFPAANEDALTVYRALRAGGTPADRIVLAGDSAGGGMALVLAMTLRAQGESPRCLALIEPWVDLSETAAWRTASPCGDGLLVPADIADFAQQYVGGASTDPAASPVLGDLSGLPPLIVHTAGDDPLRGDAFELIAAAKAAGTTVDHADYPGMWHVFQLFAGYLAAADGAVDALVESILRT